MTTALERIVELYKTEPDAIFVFPAEAVVSNLSEKILKNLDCNIIPKERLISWDRFIEQVFPLPSNFQKSNLIVKILFAAYFLKDNEKNSRLKVFIKEEFAGNSLSQLKSLTEILSSLADLPIKEDSSALDISKKKDFKLIYEAYKNFLGKSPFREPTYEKLNFQPPKNKYYLFYSEVIIDHFGQNQLIKIASENIKKITVEDAAETSKFKSIRFYQSVLAELTDVLEQVHKLLKNGVLPSEIVLTVGNLTQLEPYLKAKAELLDLNLNIHQANSLLSLPGVNYLKKIAELLETNFSFSAFEDLLKNKNPAFKEEYPITELLNFGWQHNCVSFYTEKGKIVDPWLERFKFYPNDLSIKRLKRFYIKLRFFLKKIKINTDFQGLSKLILKFNSIFLDENSFTESAKQHLKLALNLLEQMAYVASFFPKTDFYSCLMLWLNLLAATPYVSAEKQAGISVYPYKVSAGIYPCYHFIINACESATRFQDKTYAFLTAAEREALGLIEQDLTELLFKLYKASGENVYISFSKLGVNTTEMASPFLLKEIKRTEIETDSQSASLDHYQKEELFWLEGKIDEFDFLFKPQLEGYKNAFLSNSILYPDYFNINKLESSLQEKVLKLFSQSNNSIQLTATDLDVFIACPFGLLIQKLIISLNRFEIFSQINPLWLGNFYHLVLENFFKCLSSKESKTTSHEEVMLKAFKKAVSLKKSELPLRPYWKLNESFYIKDFIIFLEKAKNYLDKKVAKVEEKITLQRDLEVANVKVKLNLCGKIDLLLEEEEYYLLLDFKKGSLPAQKALLPQDEEPFTYQLLFYIFICEALDKKIKQAGFYSFKKKAFSKFFENPISQTDKQNISSLIDDLIEKYSRCLIEGDFRIINNKPNCSACFAKTICRKHYLTAI